MSSQCSHRKRICEYPEVSYRGKRAVVLTPPSTSSSSTSANLTVIKPRPKSQSKRDLDTVTAKASSSKETAQEPSPPRMPLSSPLPRPSALLPPAASSFDIPEVEHATKGRVHSLNCSRRRDVLGGHSGYAAHCAETAAAAEDQGK